uniref:Reverse transcriptase domain-containing protein n=1 Tax=Tanacetum cinerariifolium TaxID=118510 RepID=A0A6L2L5L4_TANCI|nr:hypothetical protein [Tanacetum cinerariifolium]
MSIKPQGVSSIIPVGGKLRDKSAEESCELIEDLALYDNESWNDLRGLTKPVKEISLPQGVPSTSDRFVPNFMTSQDARFSKFEADFKQQQSEMTNKIDTFLKAINDRMTGALPSDIVKNPKLNVNPISLVLSARSYSMEDPQSSSNPFKSVNPIKTCFKSTNTLPKDQPQIKTLTVDIIETPKSREPKKALEDEFKDLHLNLSVLEVLAHAPMYNAILDKYVESFELGKDGFAFTQSKIPKMKDHGLFILPCRLGDSEPFDTLADLGSCVSLILLYLFKKIKIRLLEETENVLGLADETKSYHIGILRDVEVYIGKLKLLEDFYVIDMEKDPTCPLLVGRGFLATASAIIVSLKI